MASITPFTLIISFKILGIILEIEFPLKAMSRDVGGNSLVISLRMPHVLFFLLNISLPFFR
jgi:hypothetical protein